jgi:GTP cyclohydrolase I
VTNPVRIRPFDLERAARAGAELLAAFGEDHAREGLSKTPERMAKAWREMLVGYDQDPSEVLKTSAGDVGFREGGVDQMVVIAGIEYASTCEHHLLPFLGTADVGYLPDPEDPIVVGASKLPRLVEVFARRLQVQERMGQQIANALNEHLRPLGVGVRMKATHLCMVCRGVEKRAPMATEVLMGRFRDPEVRAEFWQLATYAARV